MPQTLLRGGFGVTLQVYTLEYVYCHVDAIDKVDVFKVDKLRLTNQDLCTITNFAI